MNQNEIAKIVVHCCYHIHTTLGSGLYEKIYEEILCLELEKAGLSIRQQPEIPVIWKNQRIGLGFRADIIVEDQVLIEIKSVAAITPVHYKQVITYLKLTKLKLGLLINFNEALIKNGISRIVNGL